MANFKWHMLVAGCCVFVSVLGVYVAVVLGDSSHGGRGGAIGVGVSFFVLFVSSGSRYNSLETLDATTDEVLKMFEIEKSDSDTILRNSKRIGALKNDLVRQQIVSNKENIFLAVGGGISTLFWGFGDLIALILISSL